MKRFFIGALTLVLTCSMAVSQASLLNEATNGLFFNVNDYVIKPNIMFNTVNTKQILIGGGYDTMGIKNGANSGASLGYYHPGAIRWSVTGYLNLTSEEHEVEEIYPDQGVEVQYENPAFEKYAGGARFTIGFPNVMNLSAGLLFLFDGNTTQPIKRTQTENGKTTDIIPSGESNLDFTIGIPVGLEFTPAIYNYLNPILHIVKKTTIAGNSDTNAPAGSGGNAELKDDTETNIAFTVYDKLTIQDLLPAPFGAETAFWIGIGNVELSTIDDLEKPAYTVDGDTVANLTPSFATQFGMSNLLVKDIGDIQVKMKPMVYFDILTASHKSFTFGATIAAAAGIYAPLGQLPMVLFCGVTPSVQFYTTTYNSETTVGNTTTTDKAASRAVTTNVLWSGKIGTSIILPKDMFLDVTFNVNNNENNGPMTLGLSAQMTITL